jgi:S1-C subfamily serine protease
MKRLFAVVGAVLALFTVPASSDSFPHATVRHLLLEGEQHCSAVVIRPGKVLTAKHCLAAADAPAMLTVDGLPAVGGAIIDSADIASLDIPGVQCPCAEVGKLPKVGDSVIAVGFGFGDEPEKARTISPVGRVFMVDLLKKFLPSAEGDPLGEALYIIVDAPIVQPGDSGGGLFARQDGRWKLVGINSLLLFRPDSPECNPFFGCRGRGDASGFVPIFKEIL